MTQQKLALVLGATGGVGGEVARALLANGWTVRALARGQAGLPGLDIDWVKGDAMERDDVVNAARGAALIVHAVNPPGYRNWGTLVLPMLENTIAAARASGARVLLPGTLYNYGASSAGSLDEATPQLPSSRKGEIRVQMEQRLRDSGVRVLIVRAGDFFGPRAGNNWFSQGMVKPGKPVTTLIYPGARGTGHAWAYLPDLADTMVRLAGQEARLGVFETFHFGGHWDADGAGMIAAIRRVVGKPKLTALRMPWWPLRMMAPFVALFKEMAEVRYLWQRSFSLDNAKLLRFLGSETHTPLDQAVAASLQGLGCNQA